MLSNDDEHEEQLVYLNFENMESLVELFAQPLPRGTQYESDVRSDDPKLLDPSIVKIKPGLVWNETLRMAHDKKRKLDDNVLLKLHNLESKMPVLQIGNRYYTGKCKIPLGTQLFFQKNPSTSANGLPNGSDQPSTSSSSIRGSKQLQSLLGQDPNAFGGIESIPRDGLFSVVPPSECYDLVAKTDKVISFNFRRSENRPQYQYYYPKINTQHVHIEDSNDAECDPLEFTDKDILILKQKPSPKKSSKRIANLKSMIVGTYVKRKSGPRKKRVEKERPKPMDNPEPMPIDNPEPVPMDDSAPPPDDWS